MPRVSEPISEKNLSNWKLLDRFRQLLSQTLSRRAEPVTRAGGPERKLLETHYFSLFLFGLLNPVIKSMRGLCAATSIERIQDEVSGMKVSLGSFSEAQSVFDAAVLQEVFMDLAADVPQSGGDPRLHPFADKLKAVDGTLLPALPRMHWALWVDENNRAAKLHLKFRVCSGQACEALVTAGNASERAALRAMAKPGEILICDRGYGAEYKFLDELRQIRSSFVIRIRNEPVMKVIEEIPLTEVDRAAGVTWQAMVELGSKWQGPPVRVVRVEVDRHELMLATDLEIEAELVALIYRYRWQVELFFKWLKCILGCRHLLAESASGVAIQVYSALIAALLLAAFTGKRPSKRAMELIQFYLMGIVGEDELAALLKLEKNRN